MYRSDFHALHARNQYLERELAQARAELASAVTDAPQPNPPVVERRIDEDVDVTFPDQTIPIIIATLTGLFASRLIWSALPVILVVVAVLIAYARNRR